MTKYIFPALLPLVAFVLLSGCKPSEKVSYATDQIVPTEKALLWKISGNGLKKSSYLFGTIHMIPKSDFSVSGPLRKAFDNSKRIAFEIDMKDMTSFRTQISMMTQAFMAGGKTLKDLLPAADYTFVREKMKEKGLPPGMFERLKPMFLSTMFAGGEEGPGAKGMADYTSVEMELYNMSRHRRLETAGLETAGFQMSLFDSIPYADQAHMLVESLRSEDKGDSGEGELDNMLKLYKAQDISAMHALMADEKGGMGNYEGLLVVKRNRSWIPEMGKFMRDKPTLFAVGAGHLGGDTGVVALLRRAGYRVDPLLGD